MIKKIIIIVFLFIVASSCGKKGNPMIDGKPVENKYYKN
tara:strand:- start:266 stop:382 length:117 start_codon:yes stop_codon:yes gene_type:complete